jgi:hypothetical protein
MVEITKKTPTPRAGETPIGRMMGYLSEGQTWLKYEMIAQGIRAVWVLDFYPLSEVENALIAIVQWAYNMAFQRAYDFGSERGDLINNEIMGWVEELRNEAMNFIGKLDGARIEAENWLSDHEKRLKELEKQLGLTVKIPELLKERIL